MTQNIKLIKFKNNMAGVKHVTVDMNKWQIISTCENSIILNNRAFRLSKHGQRLEYRSGSKYVELQADIESITSKQ